MVSTHDRRIYIALFVLLALAALGVARSFDPIGLSWDSAEYVWTLEAGFLPHSPYLGYLLAGRVAAVFAPTAMALSMLSALSCLACPVLLFCVLRQLQVQTTVCLLAAWLYTAFPITLAQGGTQEVYPLQACCTLAALWLLTAERRGHCVHAGFAYAFAMTVHNGTVFTLPAFAYLTLRVGSSWRRRMFEFLWPCALVGALTFAIVLYLFRAEAEPARTAIAYLRGIAPDPAVPTGWGLLLGAANTLFVLFSAENVGLAALCGASASYGYFVARKRVRPVARLWLLFAGGFFVYESMLGETLDPGAFVVHYMPAVAVFCAFGVHTLAHNAAAVLEPWLGRARSTQLGVALTAGVAMLFSVQCARVLARSFPAERFGAFERNVHVRASHWVARHLPHDAIVVQPASVENVNLLPVQRQRRPIIFQSGQLLLMRPPRPFLPMNLSSYTPVTRESMLQLLSQDKVRVFALEDHLPYDFGPALELAELPEARAEGHGVFELRLARVHDASAAH